MPPGSIVMCTFPSTIAAANNDSNGSTVDFVSTAGASGRPMTSDSMGTVAGGQADAGDCRADRKAVVRTDVAWDADDARSIADSAAAFVGRWQEGPENFVICITFNQLRAYSAHFARAFARRSFSPTQLGRFT